jgi:carboxypeptidase C (cathepsin A)
MQRSKNLRENLRISPGSFFKKLREAENESIGRFDARVIGAANQGDPSYDLVYGAYAGCLNSYLREVLNFTEDRPYEILSRSVQPWNYSQFTNGYVSVADDLTRAMLANPNFGIYIACGYRDLATPFSGITHTVNHLAISPTLRQNVEFGYYDAGHMMYTNLPDLVKLSTEVRTFIRKRQ